MKMQDRTAVSIASTLAGCGVRHVAASPGSRHTPLLLALDDHPKLSVTMHHDERSAGFVALGIGKITGTPAVVLCTSGSAVTHYLPALVEADLSTTPMIVLSADRPHELWDTGAPQTINQREIFGARVRAYASIDPNEFGDSSDRDVTSWLATHWSRATNPIPGPVHLNVELREPLLSASTATAADETNDVEPARPAPSPPPDVTLLVDALRMSERPLIVAGRLSPADTDAVRTLGERLSAPIFADPQSGLRGPDEPATVAYADVLVDAGGLDRHTPDLVIRCGPIPTSKPIWEWLGAHADIAQYVITTSGHHDPMGSATVRLVGGVAAILNAVSSNFEPSPVGFARAWQELDKIASDALDGELTSGDLTEPAVAAVLAGTSTADDILVVGSSMPLRDIDAWGGRWDTAATIANRGANGIDGTISTALGVAVASRRDTVAYIGDVTALHDVGAFATVGRSTAHLTILVVNNDGGGIFHHLPQGDPAQLDQNRFERLFGTPHGLSFATVGQAFGVETTPARSVGELRDLLAARVKAPRLIEVRTSRTDAVVERRRLRSLVRAALM
ncbi:MAG: 2-succinyl-5-enolpyruvyl-6-hydroxy-3-cyclohexene-1-carboxylic-acid synthase [Acidobacteria bacterium]|nr:2-succinyl-5-enolpyruvyl-6-hydroxy-3-cyclohexene-1-carboxylic-acid synthase [Acidobacteriota bacterium]